MNNLKIHLCMVELKPGNTKSVPFVTFDLSLRPWPLSYEHVFNPDILFCLEEHYCQIISKSIHACLSYSPDTAKCSYFLPLTQVCDLDLWAMSMVVSCDTLSCHAWWSYSPDTTKCIRFLPLTPVYDLDLLGKTWVFNATHRLNGVNICTKLFHIPLRHVWVIDQTSFLGRTD